MSAGFPPYLRTWSTKRQTVLGKSFVESADRESDGELLLILERRRDERPPGAPKRLAKLSEYGQFEKQEN